MQYLGSVIAELLFKSYPYKEEGFLTEMRSKIVNRANLNQLARKMGFELLIVFDQKTVNVQTKHHSMLGDAFEALIGAIYLDKGYNFTRNFLLKRIVKPYIDIHTLEMTETNFKSKLIEWCQRHGKDISFDMVENGEGESALSYSPSMPSSMAKTMALVAITTRKTRRNWLRRRLVSRLLFSAYLPLTCSI
jgi:ribonuclease-3